MKDLNKILLAETKNAYIYYIPEHSLVWIDFKEFEYIDVDEYKKASLELLNFVEKKNIKKLLFNTLKIKTVFPVELQEWVAENINIKLLKILDKVAVVEPIDPIATLSLHQYIEESIKYGTHSKERNFNEVEEAVEWLLK